MRRETPPINHYRGCVQDISNKINTFAGVWSCWKRKAILDCILQTGNTLFLREKQEYRGSQRSEGIKTVLSTWNVSMHALADAMGFSMEFVRKSICIIWCVDGGVVTVWRGREWKVERRVKLQRVTSIRTPPGPLTQRLVWQTHPERERQREIESSEKSCHLKIVPLFSTADVNQETFPRTAECLNH